MTRTCSCGKTKLKEKLHDPCKDDLNPSEDDYCCYDAYSHYNVGDMVVVLMMRMYITWRNLCVIVLLQKEKNVDVIFEKSYA